MSLPSDVREMTEESDNHGLPREGLTPDSTGVEMQCPSCDATFPRKGALTPKKGHLACPECGETGVVELESPGDR